MVWVLQHFEADVVLRVMIVHTSLGRQAGTTVLRLFHVQPSRGVTTGFAGDPAEEPASAGEGVPPVRDAITETSGGDAPDHTCS